MRGGVEILRIGGDDNNFFQCLIGSLCIALRPDSLQLRLDGKNKKSMKIGANGSAGGAASSFNLRTMDQDR